MEKVLSNWDGELIVTRREPLTGAILTIANHSTARGPGSGGTRAMCYPSFEDAVVDATRLAKAMTYKMAMADLPMGGGKSVISLPCEKAELQPGEWERILRLHASTLNTLAGAYWTGPDVNTSSADMDVLKETSKFVFGASPAQGGSGSSAPDTALGVFAGIKATLEALGLGDSTEDRTVLVQGAGAVGHRLAELLLEEGARVLVADVDDAKVADLERLGAAPVAATAVPLVECDVYAPCAMGGTVTAEVAERLTCKAVAGAANNPLATDAAADILDRRGILYAPDYVINAGGAIHLVGHEILGWDDDEVTSHVRRIGATLLSLYKRASANHESTEATARHLALERLVSAVGPGTALS